MRKNILFCFLLSFSFISAQIAPQAVNDFFTINEDNTALINTLVNDTDDTGIDTASLSIVTAPQRGSINAISNGLITYQPNQDWFGLDSFQYAICDVGMPVLCDSAWVYFTIVNINEAPEIFQQTVYTLEDEPVAICPIYSDSDNTMGQLTIGISENPAYGTITFTALVGCFEYLPNANWSGTDSLCVQVCDPSGACDTTCFQVNIASINDAPVAVDDAATTDEDLNVSISVVQTNDTDADGLLNPEINILDYTMNGTLTVHPTTGYVTYGPDPNFNGTDTFTYEVCENGSQIPVLCDTAEVIITINPINDAPTAINDTAYTITSAPITIQVVATNDTDVESTLNTNIDLNLSVPGVQPISTTPNGTYVNDANGNVTFTPNANWSGIDSTPYVVCDNGSTLPILCDTAIIYVNVFMSNSAPTAINDTALTNMNTCVNIDVMANDSDLESALNPTSILITESPINGTLSTDPTTGQVTFCPDLNFYGIDSFSYLVCDMGFPFLCDTATVYINVDYLTSGQAAVNDSLIIALPVLSGSIYPLLNDTVSVSSLNNVSLFQVATNGTATVSLSGYIATATYTANTNYIGQDSFSYYFCNTLLLCDTATIYVTILPNNAPVAMNDTVQTNQNTALIIPFLLNDSDDQTINTTNNTVSVLINGMHGTASSNGLNMSYVPNTNYFGLDSFSYTLCDAGLLCDTAWVFVSINPVFTATASFTNPDSCSNSCTNTITISASNGVPPYLYSINNGATYVSSPIFTNKCSGLKYIKVKDALNNIFSLSLMVTSNYISSYIFGYQAPCANNSSGTSSYIGINASGGSGQYSYLWNNGVDSNYLLSPANGLNTVLITDLVTGCTFSKSTQINNVYCSKINGNIILDFNTNCFQDTNDIPITQQYIAFQDSITNQTYYGITNSAGFYSISLPHGVYRLVIPPTLANIYTITCPSLPTYISVDSTNFIDTLNIYLTPIAYNDLNVMYTLYTIRPGFTFDNLIRYRNVGTAATNATIVLQYNPLLEPSSSNTGIIDTANHTITWTITNLAINPNYSHIYPIFLPLNSTVPLGTYICNTATISPIVGDSTPTNNVSTHCQTVVGSSDPNEKSVYPNGAIDTAIKTHRYHIDFQNLGTYYATFVIVKDKIDSHLDISSIRDVSASHNFVLTIADDNELIFTFDDIYLTAAQDDEAGSKGHIDFTIDQIANLPIGTEITNTADIYFDFNEAVITNTTLNKIEISSGINNLTKDITHKVYPNPSNGSFYLETLEENINNIVVFDLTGKKVFSSSGIHHKKALINLKGLDNGTYILQIHTKNKISSSKIIINKDK